MHSERARTSSGDRRSAYYMDSDPFYSKQRLSSMVAQRLAFSSFENVIAAAFYHSSYGADKV